MTTKLLFKQIVRWMDYNNIECWVLYMYLFAMQGYYRYEMTGEWGEKTVLPLYHACMVLFSSWIAVPYDCSIELQCTTCSKKLKGKMSQCKVKKKVL